MGFLNEEYPDLMWDGKEKLPIVVSFGVGVDSTAILVGLHERGIKPDYILFADTGAERPDIYAHKEKVNKWLKSVGFPTVTTVKRTLKDGSHITLEEECHRDVVLPSLAFGKKKCSDKFKVRPQNAFARAMGLKKYIKVIGYGTGEIDRAINGIEKAGERYDKLKRQSSKDDFPVQWFPLIDWKLNRAQCKELSKTVGFCTAKSSCFFCPAMKVGEIIKLRDQYPEHYERALLIEDGYLARKKKAVDSMTFNESLSSKYTVNGLGRNWSWREKVAEYDRLSPEFSFMEEFRAEKGADLGCGCTDF